MSGSLSRSYPVTPPELPFPYFCTKKLTNSSMYTESSFGSGVRVNGLPLTLTTRFQREEGATCAAVTLPSLSAET